MMHSSMTSFTQDIESRLDKVYKKGASEKFGFEDIVKQSQKGYVAQQKSTFRRNESERKIDRIAKEASQYLESQSDISVMSSSSSRLRK